MGGWGEGEVWHSRPGSRSVMRGGQEGPPAMSRCTSNQAQWDRPWESQMCMMGHAEQAVIASGPEASATWLPQGSEC